MRWILAVVAMTASACGDSLSGPTPGHYTGHWTGTFIVRQCVPVGFTACEGTEAVGSVHAIDLMLIQTGATVSGTLQVTEAPINAMNVGGTISGNVLTISGEVSDTFNNRVSFYRLRTTRWTTSVDDDGAMHGAFGLRHAWTWGIASMRPIGETWTLEQDAEISSLKPTT
jgi:hypothetical protein